VLGLVGPNGAGKTTVFDAICGLVPARGRVVLEGRDVSGMPTASRARAGLGRSFQDARLFPSLTVTESLAMAFERHVRAEGVVSTMVGAPWVRRSERHVARRVEELIELMGLTAFRDKFVSELSTGSRRIVDLAMTLAHDPSVVLLDEPSSGIAQRETEALGPMLLRVRDETGATMLVVEHDMPLVTSISDELLALETGRVLLRGEPRAVLDDPQLVSAYLGTDRAVVERSGAHPAKTHPAKKRAPRKAAKATKATKKAQGTGKRR
jgi:ABC-type branched-subunit amino acid transport system ATPase component